jgi:hypothetical protein
MTIEMRAARSTQRLAPVAGYVAIEGHSIAISLDIQLLRIAPRELVQNAE